MRRTAGLLLAVACAGVMGCSDDSPAPAPTATGGAAATRTPTHAAVATPTQGGGNPTATPTSGQVQPTFTATPQSGEPTSTPGGSNPAQAQVEKFITSTLAGLSRLGSFALPANVGGAAFDFPPIDIPMDIPPVTTDCTGSGQQTISCTTSGGKGRFKISFANCHNAVEGGESFFDGDISVALLGSCFLPQFGDEKPFDVAINATLDTLSAGDRVAGRFDLAEVVTQHADSTLSFTVDGTASTDCAGDFSLQTVAPVVISQSGGCARAGRLAVGIAGERHAVAFTDGGGLDIDLGDDGSVDTEYGSCDDQSIQRCE